MPFRRHVNPGDADFVSLSRCPQPTAIEGHFVEQFTPDWTQRWSPSKATKEEKQGEVRPSSTSFHGGFTATCLMHHRAQQRTDSFVMQQVFSYVGQWSVEEPSVFPGLSNDAGLVLKTKAAHHAISAQFDTPLDPKGKTLVAQYEVKLQKGLDCGGAYLKLLTDSDEVRTAAVACCECVALTRYSRTGYPS